MGHVDVTLTSWERTPEKPPCVSNVIGIKCLNRADAPRWVLLADVGAQVGEQHDIVAAELVRFKETLGAGRYSAYGNDIAFSAFRLPAGGMLDLAGYSVSSDGDITSIDIWDAAEITDGDGRSLDALFDQKAETPPVVKIHQPMEAWLAATYEPPEPDGIQLTLTDLHRQTLTE